MFIVSVMRRQCVDSLKHLCYLFVTRPPNISFPERAMRLQVLQWSDCLVRRYKFSSDCRTMSYHRPYTRQTCLLDLCRPIELVTY